jgi:ferredoxin-type protein NapG
MNRRDFFQTAFQKIMNVCGDLIEGKEITRLLKPLDLKKVKKQRPPGASKTDHEFVKLCTGCDACMAACPVNIIMIEDLQLRHPVIYPDEDPCLHCEGYPCIQSCPTAALNLSNGVNLREF